MNKKAKILTISLSLVVLAVISLAVLGIFGNLASAGKTAPRAKCTDTDGGINYYVQGNCSGANGNFADYCVGNVCNEYYCDSKNKCVISQKNCAADGGNGTNGTCYNGACHLS